MTVSKTELKILALVAARNARQTIPTVCQEGYTPGESHCVRTVTHRCYYGGSDRYLCALCAADHLAEGHDVRQIRQTIELAPAHPVYAQQEDITERDRQAEDAAGAYFEMELRHRSVLEQGEDVIVDALRDLFIAGWNAAREQQR